MAQLGENDGIREEKSSKSVVPEAAVLLLVVVPKRTFIGDSPFPAIIIMIGV
jgi:hypothetical protein